MDIGRVYTDSGQLNRRECRSIQSWLSARRAEVRAKLMCLAVLVCAVCAGCMAAAAPKVLLYGPPYPAKPADAHIEVYKAARPDVAFLEIAQISCRDTGDDCNMKQILMKAREVGADAIMIIGQSGPYGEDDALTAIAIRYK